MFQTVEESLVMVIFLPNIIMMLHLIPLLPALTGMGEPLPFFLALAWMME